MKLIFAFLGVVIFVSILPFSFPTDPQILKNDITSALHRKSPYNEYIRVNGFEFKIKNIHAMRFVNQTEHNDQQFNHVSKSCVINRNNRKQQGQTPSYKQTITRTATVTVTNTAEISGTVKIPKLPFLNSISLKFAQSRATTDTITIAVELAAPSQKIDVDPQTKVAIIYQLKTFKNIYNYL